MTAPNTATSWGATALGVASALLALAAGGVLLVGASDSHASARSDVAWAMLSAAPEVVVVALSCRAAIAARRADTAGGVGATALAVGAAMAPASLVGGLWAMLLATNNDAKWLAVTAGGVGALAAALLAVGGAVLRRHPRAA